jgi:hypothetical protein
MVLEVSVKAREEKAKCSLLRHQTITSSPSSRANPKGKADSKA